MPKPATLPPSVAVNNPPVPNVVPNPVRQDPRPPTIAPGRGNRPANPDYGDDCKFTKIPNHTVGFLWAAACQKFAYVNAPTGIESLKTLIGADEVIQVTGLGETVPNGLRIKYPGKTIFVIQGTTRRNQVELYRNGGSRIASYDISKDGPVVSGTAGKREKYLGSFFVPIMDMAIPWMNHIGSYLNNESYTEGREVYIVGHSLGAAVAEIVSLMGSWAQGKVDWSLAFQGGTMRQVLDPGNWKNRFKGGYIFGKPKIFHYGVPWADFFPATADRTDRYVRTGTPRGELASMLKMYNQFRDPIPKLIANRKEAPFYIRWVGASSNTQVVDAVSEWTFPAHSQYAQAVNDQGNSTYYYPPSPEIFQDDMASYHGIQTYLNAVVRRVENRYGTLPSYWSNLVQAALLQPSDEFLSIGLG